MPLGTEISGSDAEVPSAMQFTSCTLSAPAPHSLLLASLLPYPAQLQLIVMEESWCGNYFLMYLETSIISH